VNLLGSLPELNYPMFLVTHKDIRGRPRVNAFFEFCLRELKPVLLHGVMGEHRGGLATGPCDEVPT
jgi:protein tyrosine/serine phosphatase